LREEHILFGGESICRLRERLRIDEKCLQFVAQQLGVKHLLGVFPFVQRLRLVESFVALQTNQLAPARRRPGFGEFRFANACRTLRQDRFVQSLGEKQHRANFVGGDVVLLA
jgi:hypothetical protein